MWFCVSTIHFGAMCRRGQLIVVAVLLATQAGLLAYSATRHSPTHLEPAFLAAGISHWELGRLELYRVNPPLPRMIAAAPAVVLGCQTDWGRFSNVPGSRPEFPVGEDFLRSNGRRSQELLVYGRWACIPLSLLGAFLAYCWGSRLYGAGAGLVALSLIVFEPNLLAHGELVTPDAACWTFGLLAGYTFWRWLEFPGWTNAFLAGAALGLAELSKFTWLILFAWWPLIWLAVRFGWLAVPSQAAEGGSLQVRIRPNGLQMGAILVMALYVINLGYFFSGFGERLGDLSFVSRALNGQNASGEVGNRFAEGLIGELRLPLPTQYLLGIDAQQRDFEVFHQDSFLRGEWKRGGWWHYYLYGLGVKVPIAVLLMFFAALAMRVCQIRVSGRSAGEAILLLPAFSLLVLASSQTAFSIHLRYVLPVIAVTLIFSGQLFAWLSEPDALSRLRFERRWMIAYRVGLVGLWFGGLASLLTVFPHHRAYFNEFAGGIRGGHRHLLGSSYDWGQGWVVLWEAIQEQADEGDLVLVETVPLELISPLVPVEASWRLIDLRARPLPDPAVAADATSVWVVTRPGLQSRPQWQDVAGDFVRGRSPVSAEWVGGVMRLTRYVNEESKAPLDRLK